MRMKNKPDAIRKIRTEIGLTQTELARKCGMSERALKNIEQGKSKSSQASTLLEIANVTNTPFGELHDGPAEEMKPKRSIASSRSQERANDVGSLPVFIVFIVHQDTKTSGKEE